MSRILKISATLAVLGAVAGAVGGCLALALAVILGKIGHDTEITLSFVAGVVTTLGAACGVFIAPVLSWTLLRDVPIWRCATETAVATSFAGILALALGSGDLWKSIAIAALAAALAAARLKWAFRRRRPSGAQTVDTGATL
jgi:hypothetical protein